MSAKIDKAVFANKLEKYQGRLNRQHRRTSGRGISTIVVFEGWDAAGKGGAVRRLTAALDARAWQVIPIAAPSDEERAYHYLWRFWRHLPRAGVLTIFDRSWYGRVLVERVEGFASPAEWRRAYSEINDFEEQLIDDGIVLIKCWLNITSDEHCAGSRSDRPRHSSAGNSTTRTWRNRKKWNEYQLAVNEMIERTSTRVAPWTIVESNDKYSARIKVRRTICDRLESALS